jgi:purine-binding chemotaxis protein CheW
MKNENTSENQTLNKYICFNLGVEKYAIPLLTVKEVIRVPEITSVPQTAPHFLGIMNLRGQVISIMDLRKKLNLKESNSVETTVMILNFGKNQLGVMVDCVNYVVSLSDCDISERPVVSSTQNTDYITGVYRKENELILVLDIIKALSVEELRQMGMAA